MTRADDRHDHDPQPPLVPGLAPEEIARNLAHWAKHFTTPFAQTREVNLSYKFTQINAYWRMMCATAMFGPLGHGWGWDIVEEKYLEGDYASGDTRELAHILKIKLWTKIGGEKGYIEAFGTTKIIQRGGSRKGQEPRA